MNIEVTTGTLPRNNSLNSPIQQRNTQTYHISLAALIKHMGCVAQGRRNAFFNLKKAFGAMLYYSDYLFPAKTCFSVPSNNMGDPTEKAQFSNIAGLAIADYLSKKINHAKFTIHYEAAMVQNGISISGSRPDLIAYCPHNICLAIEAKGFSRPSVSLGDINKHKNQSRNIHPQLGITNSYVSIAYNLYNQPKVYYIDPEFSNTFDNHTTLKYLSMQFYQSILDETSHLNKKSCISGFYKVLLSDEITNLCSKKIFLVLPEKIKDFANKGINDYSIFEKDVDMNNNFYIDNDYIGIQME
ncbi:MAG: hypothetical protein IJ905_16940 [Fibrobacter sp.]|nr:hypothetical protein [Fibrobacter sp.]